MSNFIESRDEFKHRKKIEEASEEADKNQQLSDKQEQLKQIKLSAVAAKEAYEAATDAGEDSKAQIELLKFKKFKGQGESLAADIQLMKLNVDSDADQDTEE